MEKNGDRGFSERGSVDLELQRGKIEGHVEVQVHVGRSEGCSPRCCGVGKRMEVGFKQRVAVGLLRRGGVFVSSADIAQNSGVEASVKPSRADIGVRANPVVAGILGGFENERVALTSKDLDAVDGKRLSVNTINFDDRLSSS